VTKPYKELAVVESELSKLLISNLESSCSLLSSPAPLTVTGLQILKTEFKKEESSNTKHFDILALRLIKKQAISYGRLPSLSIRTTYSNDFLRRILTKGVSLKRLSFLQQQVTLLLKTQDLDESEIIRLLATRKRLFEPDADLLFAA
jgi:hypothetical protein